MLYQGVTLGSTTKERGKRHPTVGDRVVVGAGATVLGDISLGNDSRVGAGAVVVHSVPAGATAVGIPGKVVKTRGDRMPGLEFERIAACPEPKPMDIPEAPILAQESWCI